MTYSKTQKPWGWYQVLSEGENYVTKELYIAPYQQISLQQHFEREEHWHILKGSGTLTLGKTKKLVFENDYIFVPLEEVHRLKADSQGILLLELQKGNCDESDIVRLSDDYDRT